MYLSVQRFVWAGVMAAMMLLTGCHDPLVGSWVCTLYVNGSAVANASNEVFVFSREGEYSWTTSQGGLERTYLGNYVNDVRPRPRHIDVSISSYIESGVETNMPDVTSLGIYAFEGLGRARQLYLNVSGGTVRPAAEALDKDVGPVWVGHRLDTGTPGLAEKLLTLFSDASGVSFFSGFE